MIHKHYSALNDQLRFTIIGYDFSLQKEVNARLSSESSRENSCTSKIVNLFSVELLIKAFR